MHDILNVHLGSAEGAVETVGPHLTRLGWTYVPMGRPLPDPAPFDLPFDTYTIRAATRIVEMRRSAALVLLPVLRAPWLFDFPGAWTRSWGSVELESMPMGVRRLKLSHADSSTDACDDRACLSLLDQADHAGPNDRALELLVYLVLVRKDNSYMEDFVKLPGRLASSVRGPRTPFWWDRVFCPKRPDIQGNVESDTAASRTPATLDLLCALAAKLDDRFHA